jgi:hydroxymethylpyrimidine pyrophosphatase-like HAD family hydrolase
VNPELSSHRRIVLLDLDGTLIDQEYKLTVSEESIRALIDKIQSRNTLVGLNSDTPLMPLRLWARRLGLKGPLIAEKGQVLALSPTEEPLLEIKMRDYFKQLRQRVILTAPEKFEAAFVGVGDVTEFIREGGHVYGVDRCAILINGYRQCSFSAYALGSEGKRLVKDPEIFDQFCDFVLSLVSNNLSSLDVPDRNADYGILILHEKGASKSIGVKRLMGILGTDIEYVMIGDGDSDMIDTDHSIRLCAVGNASPRLKETVCESGGIIAHETFTKGVLEILASLD